MTTDQFVEKFNEGQLVDDSDWFEWEYFHDAYKVSSETMSLS